MILIYTLILNIIISILRAPLMEYFMEYEYIIWDCSLMLQVISLTYVSYKMLPVGKIGSRLLSFAFLIFAISIFFEYIIKVTLEYHKHYYIANLFATAIYIAAIIPVLINMFKPVKKISDQYKPSDSYVVYKKGSSKLSLLFGQSFIVCEGMKYYYREGILTKTHYFNNAKKHKNDVYERIDLNQEKIDGLIGSHWSFSRNCYSLNEKICSI